MILCSKCIDTYNKNYRIISIKPQKVCEQCGKFCLGYEVEFNFEIKK